MHKCKNLILINTSVSAFLHVFIQLYCFGVCCVEVFTTDQKFRNRQNSKSCECSSAIAGSVRSVSFTLNVCECQQVWDIYFRMRIAWQFSLQFSVCKLVERGWLVEPNIQCTQIQHWQSAHTHILPYTHTKLNFGWKRATYG